MHLPGRDELALLETIFAPYQGVHDEACRAFVRALLDASMTPNTFKAQRHPAFPWWAIGISGSALYGLCRYDPRVQVHLLDTAPWSIVEALAGRDVNPPRPPILDGQVWLFTNGQSALVTQTKWRAALTGTGYGHLAGEGLVRLDNPPTWHPPRWVGPTPLPLVLLAGPSPWGRDVPWVDWALWPTVWFDVARAMGLVPSPRPDSDKFEIVLDTSPPQEPKLP